MSGDGCVERLEAALRAGDMTEVAAASQALIDWHPDTGQRMASCQRCRRSSVTG